MKTTIQNITDLPATGVLKRKQSVSKHISNELTKTGFIFLPKNEMRNSLLEDVTDLHEAWMLFQDSWNRLQRDTFMADGGRYRLRRHATYKTIKNSKVISPTAYRPHYQRLEHNGLNGGVARYFSPLEPATCNNPILINTLAHCRTIFGELIPGCEWHIEVHQFRIETCAVAACPTPEGVHRDGVNFVFMMLIDRQQISGGTTFLYDQSGALLQQHKLVDAMESAFINDERVLHGVSPISPATQGRYGYRDMLVITFRKA